MPIRPGKACRQLGCSEVAKHSQHHGYCEKHKDKAGWHANERMKGNRHQRGYGSDWDKIRSVALSRDKHLCQECKRNGVIKTGSHVDHIKPKALGGTNALSNLQTLCELHHSAKTAREARQGGGSNL